MTTRMEGEINKHCKALDSDIHIIDPADLWQRYIDAEFRDPAPYGLTERQAWHAVRLQRAQPQSRGAT